MKRVNFDRLVIFDDERVLLTHSDKIADVVYNDRSELYKLDDDGNATSAADKVYDGEVILRHYDKYDEVAGAKKIMLYDTIEGEMRAFARASWDELEHHLECTSEHGINISYYDLTDADIIEGNCYLSNFCIEQNYPTREYTDFLIFNAADGRVFYIKRVSSFYPDAKDDFFKLMTKAEFDDAQKK